MSDAATYLRKREWSMGNGQCPDCHGVPASWHGHPCHMTAESIGHEKKCDLAAALVALGEKPLMKGEFTSDVEYEHYISEIGIYGTRPKTANGCPRYRSATEKMQQAWREAILAAVRDAP